MQYFFYYWNVTRCHVDPNTRQNSDATHPPACLSIPCFPHLCLCSSSSPYSSFPNPSAPGSIPRFYFVYIWTGTNKGKSNIKLAVCSRIYILTCAWSVCFHLMLNRGRLTSAVLRRARSFTSSADTVLLLPCLKNIFSGGWIYFFAIIQIQRNNYPYRAKASRSLPNISENQKNT